MNVHPTKKEVHLLNESRIHEILISAVDAKLMEKNHSRTFDLAISLSAVDSTNTPPLLTTTTTLSKVKNPLKVEGEEHEQAHKKHKTVALKRKEGSLRGHELSPLPPSTQHIRTDAAAQTLQQQRWLHTNNNNHFNNNNNSNNNNNNTNSLTSQNHSGGQLNGEESSLYSVKYLQDLSTQNKSVQYQNLFGDGCYVGCVESEGLLLMQCGSQLLMLQITPLLQDFFYDFCLRGCGHFECVPLEPPVEITALLEIGILQCEEDIGALHSNQLSEGNVESVAKVLVNILISHIDLLRDYWGITIAKFASSGSYFLISLPVIGDREFLPPLETLPMFLCKILTGVDWEYEMDTMAKLTFEISTAYTLTKVSKDTIKNILFPMLKKYHYVPSQSLVNRRAVIEIASLDQLFKVFERC